MAAYLAKALLIGLSNQIIDILLTLNIMVNAASSLNQGIYSRLLLLQIRCFED